MRWHWKKKIILVILLHILGRDREPSKDKSAGAMEIDEPGQSTSAITYQTSLITFIIYVATIIALLIAYIVIVWTN